MTRLFIAEVSIPDTDDMTETRRAMDWMRCVLANRLKHPADFSADRHSRQIIDIIRAKQNGSVQFQGFESYPIIDRKQGQNIKNRIGVAEGRADHDQRRHARFIHTAIEAATGSPPTDPTPTGLCSG